ncbi:MAG TPA: hypothetical protein VFU12_20635 [Glycomyces sp.]|nr:hypothetical protein [Glycomyces sp.]
MSQPGNPFADVLKETLELSKQVQAGQDAEPDDEEQVVERAEGRIRVTAGAGGEIGIALDPKAMRLGSEELAQELTSAVNEALASLREQQLNAKNLDLDAINEQVAELQQKASAQLSSFMDGVLRAHAAADRTEPVKE